MYFPYFRGRQYELLALRELVQNRLLGKSVMPVVEPIKITPTLNTTMAAYVEAEMHISLILNPAVGDLVKNTTAYDALYSQYFNNSYVIPALLLGRSSHGVIEFLASKGLSKDSVLTLLDKRDSLDMFNSLFSDRKPKYTLCPYDRHFSRAAGDSRVLFDDRFNKQDKNADYPPDEFFSDDHTDFEVGNYIGFGDYSVIGNNFDESGFAPRAVAIHIVYLTSDYILRVKHFVSDTNIDTSDVAGKFGEAVSKLMVWYSDGQHRQLTSGLATLLDYAATGYFPGLPTIKKLSIMHHLELMSKYLEGGRSI